MMSYTKPSHQPSPMLGVGKVEGLFESSTVSVWLVYGMWCDQTGFGLNLFLRNDTFKLVFSP
jgi:hypothetical protein